MQHFGDVVLELFGVCNILGMICLTNWGCVSKKSGLNDLIIEFSVITSKLRSTARKRGYELGINFPSDVYMCQTSFVAYENGQLVVLSNIPMYKNKHLMKLLEYQPTPIILSNQTQQQLFIKPQKPTVAVDEDPTLYHT